MMLAHNVFFKLKDSSDEAIKKLCDSGREFLSGHPGEAFFAIGTLNKELDREVNDKEFDVALHVIFETKEAQDVYQTADRHLKFIELNKDNWASVRVFDSDVA